MEKEVTILSSEGSSQIGTGDIIRQRDKTGYDILGRLLKYWGRRHVSERKKETESVTDMYHAAFRDWPEQVSRSPGAGAKLTSECLQCP